MAGRQGAELMEAMGAGNSRDCPWQALALPAEVTRIPSMLSPEEKQYLCWLSSEAYEGWGAIVDLGPWLGSSSAALAEGLRRRGPQRKVHSFDLFQWEPDYMEAIARKQLPLNADFLPAFLEETAAYTQWIDARKQDLSAYRWEGGPIEILFVDAAKTWELTNAILRGFGAALEPGRSRVVLQDFRYYETHWLPLIFDSRPDLWEQVEAVQQGYTVTFRPLRRLDGPAGVHGDYSEDAFSLAAAERLLRERLTREEVSNHHWFLRMLYRKYLMDGSAEGARRVRAELLRYISPSNEEMARVEDVESILVPRAWKAYDSGKYGVALDIARRLLAASGKRSPYALELLGFASLRLGDTHAAQSAFQELLAGDARYLSAQLGSAEVDLAESRAAVAEERVREVVAGNDLEPGIARWAGSILAQAWAEQPGSAQELRDLTDLYPKLRTSPHFLTRLAAEQAKAGQVNEARRVLETALRLETDAAGAASIREQWHALPDDRGAEAQPPTAGSLHRPEIPSRPAAAGGLNLSDLTSEILARVDQGAFVASEENILLGLELKRSLQRSLEVHNNRFSLRRYRDLYDCFYAYAGPPFPRIQDATIADLGCGSQNPFGVLFLFLMLGARRGIAIDLEGVQSWDRAAEALAELAAAVTVAPNLTIGDHRITREDLLRNVASFDLARLGAGDRTGIDPARLTYRRESVHSLTLEGGEADLVFSNAFLEHIDSPERGIVELARITKPGGMGVHVIDCSDHRRYHDAGVHPLKFLTEKGNHGLVHGSNRLRPAQFRRLFESTGFEVLATETFERTDITAGLRSQLAAPFLSMSDEELADTIVKFVVRRAPVAN